MKGKKDNKSEQKKAISLEEKQDRREFLKNLGKTALPAIAFLGLGVLGGKLNGSQEMNRSGSKPRMDCVGACMDSCEGGCKGTCENTCHGSCTGCEGSCKGGCYHTCTGDCKGTCSGTCEGIGDSKPPAYGKHSEQH